MKLKEPCRDFIIEAKVYNEKFYAEMVKALDEIFPNKEWLSSSDNPPYCTAESTSGWAIALKKACTALGYKDYWKYWTELPWYDSDLCDKNLSEAIARYYKERK